MTFGITWILAFECAFIMCHDTWSVCNAMNLSLPHQRLREKLLFRFSFTFCHSSLFVWWTLMMIHCGVNLVKLLCGYCHIDIFQTYRVYHFCLNSGQCIWFILVFPLRSLQHLWKHFSCICVRFRSFFLSLIFTLRLRDFQLNSRHSS